LLAALGPLVVLAVDPWGWYPFGPVKWLVLTVVGVAGTFLVLASHELRVTRTLGWALGGFIAAMVGGAVVGEDALYAWIGTPERHFGVLTWVLCAGLLLAGRTMIDEADGRVVVNGLLVAGAAVGAIASLEAIGFEPRLLDVASRLTGTFGSAAYLGAATALLLPIAIGAALDDAVEVEWRYLGAAGAGLLAVACAGAGARAAWVGLAGSVILALVARRLELVDTVRAAPGRSAAVLCGLAVVGVLVVALSPMGARIGSLTDDGAPGGRGRLDEWRVASRVVGDHPLLGVGPEGYRIAFAGAVDEAYQRAHGRVEQPDRAHSGPLDIALSGGVVALGCWVVLVGLVGRSAWSALRDGPTWLAGVAAALVAHVVTQLFFFPVAELEPVAWLLGGIVLAGAPVGARSRLREHAPDWVLRAVGLVVVATLAAGVTDVVADHRARRAADALDRGDGRAAAAAAASAVDLRGDVLRLHLLAARADLLDQQGTATALHQVDDALALSPGDPIALRTKAELLVARGVATGVPEQRQEAADFVAARLDADPYDPALWELQATIEQLRGEPAKAAEAQDRATELTPPSQR
jgi:O-antigen ligase